MDRLGLNDGDLDGDSEGRIEIEGELERDGLSDGEVESEGELERDGI